MCIRDRDWDICLPQPAAVSTFLAADYYLQGSDNGYGLYDAQSGSVGGYNAAQNLSLIHI